MKRRNQNSSDAAKTPVKSEAGDMESPAKTKASEMGNPFATFTEWSGEADEKAYARL